MIEIWMKDYLGSANTYNIVYLLCPNVLTRNDK